jgi:Protein of unknown function (DUF3105)
MEQTHTLESVRPRPDRRWVWAAALLLLVLVLLVFSALRLSYQAQLPGLVAYANLERGETNGPFTYAQSPPAGGKHSPQWQNCGMYNAPVPNETAVHALAHGAVWITYRLDISIRDIAALERLARNRTYVLVSPYPDQAQPIMATAWGLQLPLDDPEDYRLMLFISRYRQGPQTLEPGQPCSGGVGSPKLR